MQPASPPPFSTSGPACHSARNSTKGCAPGKRLEHDASYLVLVRGAAGQGVWGTLWSGEEDRRSRLMTVYI